MIIEPCIFRTAQNFAKYINMLYFCNMNNKTYYVFSLIINNELKDKSHKDFVLSLKQNKATNLLLVVLIF